MKRFLCILLALLLLASCGQTPSEDSSSKLNVKNDSVDDIGDFSLVMTTDNVMGERDMTLLIQETIKEKCNVELKLVSDAKESEGKEILVGKTSRAQSQGEFKYNDYVIKKDGDCIVINGGSKTALKVAVELFLNEFVTDKVTIPSSEYLKTFEYSLENGTVGGILLSDFAVMGEGEEFDALRDILGSATGVMPKEEGANTISFAEDNTLGSMQVKSEFKDGNIILYTSGTGISKTLATKILKDIFASATSNEVSVDKTQEIVPENLNIVTDEQLSEWRDETDDRIAEIKNTANLKIPAGANVYYVSNKGRDSNDGKSPDKAWATLERVSNTDIPAGSYVLFERGGYFRGSLSTKAGVTYSAYGVGEKPIICGSTEDGADPNKWTNVGGNIWEYETAFDKDVGSLVFNHGEAHAIKWLVYKNAEGKMQEYRTKAAWTDVSSMTEDLHFWHSTENQKIYLYSKENPGKRFSSIEFLRRVNAIGVGGDNVTLDNLCIKYTGAHGAGGGTKKNFTVQNCEFGWIGGSIQFVNYSGAAPRPTRYGNGIEIYGGCDGFTVENCYFYQIYDAAVTHQYSFDDGSTDMTDLGHYNVTFKDNVMEYCVYSIEYFLGNVPDGNQSYMDNVLYEGNLMWYAGEGLGSQRPDPTQPAHIKGWGHYNYTKNFVIKDNLMVYSTAMLVHTNYTNKYGDGTVGIKLENNIIVGRYGQRFGMYGYRTADVTVNYTPEISDYLKAFSNGDEFYFTKE